MGRLALGPDAQAARTTEASRAESSRLRHMRAGDYAASLAAGRLLAKQIRQASATATTEALGTVKAAPLVTAATASIASSRTSVRT